VWYGNIEVACGILEFAIFGDLGFQIGDLVLL
jgi:hypothetical protein